MFGWLSGGAASLGINKLSQSPKKGGDQADGAKPTKAVTKADMKKAQ